MEKQEKREEKRPGRGDAGQGRVVRRPVTAAERTRLRENRTQRSCHNCIFCVADLLLWGWTLLSGFPVSGQCANHPDTPGRVRRVPGTACRNFRGKHRPEGVEPPVPADATTRYIPLTRGLYALVDAEDYEWLSRYRWYATPGKVPYACRAGKRKLIFMHREIMRPPQGRVVDHINGNGLDNRRCNLRICTQEQNMANMRRQARTKSRFRGVFPRGDKWGAKVARKGVAYYLGLFDDEVEAARARDRKARELFGEYAWLNLPPESPEEQR